jgi:hypothetical protein
MEGTVSDTLLRGPVIFYEVDDGTLRRSPCDPQKLLRPPRDRHSGQTETPAAASREVREMDCAQEAGRAAGSGRAQHPEFPTVNPTLASSNVAHRQRQPETHLRWGQLLRLQHFIDNGLAAFIRGDDSVYGRISA